MSAYIFVGILLVLVLGARWFFWPSSYRVVKLERSGSNGWRAEAVMTYRSKAYPQVWLSESGASWINEQTFQEVSANWGGGDTVAFILNEAVYKAEAKETVIRLSNR